MTVRSFDDVGREAMKYIFKKHGENLHNWVNAALESITNRFTSIDRQFQLAILGKFDCRCCCKDSNGKLHKNKSNWESDRIMTPFDFDETVNASDPKYDGWNHNNPFPHMGDMQGRYNLIKARYILNEYNKCKKLCGKAN
jgi:hypothetical protein